MNPARSEDILFDTRLRKLAFEWYAKAAKSLLTIMAALAGVVLRVSVLAVVPLGSGRLLRRLRHWLLCAHLGVHAGAKRFKADEPLVGRTRSIDVRFKVCDELWRRVVIGVGRWRKLGWKVRAESESATLSLFIRCSVRPRSVSSHNCLPRELRPLGQQGCPSVLCPAMRRIRCCHRSSEPKGGARPADRQVEAGPSSSKTARAIKPGDECQSERG